MSIGDIANCLNSIEEECHIVIDDAGNATIHSADGKRSCRVEDDEHLERLATGEQEREWKTK